MVASPDLACLLFPSPNQLPLVCPDDLLWRKLSCSSCCILQCEGWLEHSPSSLLLFSVPCRLQMGPLGSPSQSLSPDWDLPRCPSSVVGVGRWTSYSFHIRGFNHSSKEPIIWGECSTHLASLIHNHIKIKKALHPHHQVILSPHCNVVPSQSDIASGPRIF